MAAEETVAHESASGRKLLLERERELARLDKTLGGALAGEGCVALIGGLPGMGKTRLLQALTERALLEGFRVLKARGSELDQEFPFGLVRQLFEPALATASSEQREKLLAGAAARSELVFAPPVDEAPAPDLGHSHLHALYWLTANLADQGPLLIAIDDFHWADPASLRFVSFLATRLEGVGAVLALALRPETTDPHFELPRDVAASPDAVRVSAGPLSKQAVEIAVRARLGAASSDDLCRSCETTSGGNPFYLEQLLQILEGRAGSSTGLLEAVEATSLEIEDISQIVLGRIAEQGVSAQRFAAALCIAGDAAPLEDVARLAGLDQAEARAAHDRLAEIEMIDVAPAVGFAHPLIRAAVKESIPRAERSAAHREAAVMAKERGSVDAAASHLLMTDAGGDTWVSRVMLDAGVLTAARGEPEIAREFFRRGLLEASAETDVEEALTFELGRLECSAHDDRGVERLAGLIARTGSVRTQGLAACELAGALAVRHRGPEMVEVTREALASLDGAEPEIAQKLQGFLLLAAAHSLATRKMTREAIAEACRIATPDGPQVLASHAGFERTFGEGKLDLGLALAEGAFTGGLLDILSSDVPSVYTAVIVLKAAGHLDDADRYLSLCLDDGRRRGSAFGTGSALAFQSWVRLDLGRLRDADAGGRASLELLPPAHQGRALAAAGLMLTAIEMGNLQDAGQFAAEFDPEQAEDGVVMNQPFIQATGELALASGDALGAISVARKLRAWEDEFGFGPETWVQPRRLEAAALLRAGDKAAAVEMAKQSVEACRAQGAPVPLGRALRLLAEAGEASDRSDLLNESVSILAAAGAELERAKSLALLGATTRIAGHDVEARKPLTDALGLAASAGAAPLVAFVSDELAATGAKPRRIDSSGSNGLTPAERRVAELAAQGASNPEIAQALFVTRKTVETHMGAIFRKLGISTRIALTPELLGEQKPG